MVCQYFDHNNIYDIYGNGGHFDFTILIIIKTLESKAEIWY